MGTDIKKLKLGHNLKEVLIYGDNHHLIIREEKFKSLLSLPEKELLLIPEIFLDDWEYEARTIEIIEKSRTVVYSDDNTFNEWKIHFI